MENVEVPCDVVENAAPTESNSADDFDDLM